LGNCLLMPNLVTIEYARFRTFCKSSAAPLEHYVK